MTHPLPTADEMTYWCPQTKALARDAWWYATGRNDERRGQPAGVTLPYVDPWDMFREYGRLAHQHNHDRSTHRPSIQDVFKTLVDAA